MRSGAKLHLLTRHPSFCNRPWTSWSTQSDCRSCCSHPIARWWLSWCCRRTMVRISACCSGERLNLVARVWRFFVCVPPKQQHQTAHVADPHTPSWHCGRARTALIAFAASRRAGPTHPTAAAPLSPPHSPSPSPAHHCRRDRGVQRVPRAAQQQPRPLQGRAALPPGR